MQPEAALAGAVVVALLGLLADLAEQAGEQCLVHGGVVLQGLRVLLALVLGGDGLAGTLVQLARHHGRGDRLRRFQRVERQLEVAAGQQQLAVGVAPFAQAQVVEEVAAAPVAQRVGAQRLALRLEAVPQVDQRGEVGVRVLPLRVGLVGGLLALHRPLARVLHRQGADHHQHLGQTALPGAFQQHAAEARVDRQARQLAAQRGQLVVAADRGQLLQ